MNKVLGCWLELGISGSRLAAVHDGGYGFRWLRLLDESAVTSSI